MDDQGGNCSEFKLRNFSMEPRDLDDITVHRDRRLACSFAGVNGRITGTNNPRDSRLRPVRCPLWPLSANGTRPISGPIKRGTVPSSECSLGVSSINSGILCAFAELWKCPLLGFSL